MPELARVEPTGTLWRCFKIIFIILNIFATIVIVFSIIGLVAIIALFISGKVKEEQKHDLIVVLSILVVFVTICTLKVVFGFIGICRLHIGCLYAYTVMIFIAIVSEITLSIYDSLNFGIFGDFALLAMMYYLINEIKKTNHIV